MAPSTHHEFRRGQIYYIHEDTYQKPIGSEMWPNRMGLIVSANANNIKSATVEVVYLTTAFKKHVSPTHVYVSCKKKTAIALCEQIHTVDKSRIGDYIGKIGQSERQKIDLALQFSLQIAPSPDILGVFKKWEHYINRYNIDIFEEQKEIRNQINNMSVNSNPLINQLQIEKECYKTLYESAEATINAMKTKTA